MSEAACNATLAGRKDLNERYSILRVRPDAVPIPDFVPGQFIQVGLPLPARARPGEEAAAPRLRIDRRSYSIASSPAEKDAYEFFLTVVAQGRLTPEIWKIRQGGRCWIDSKALGSFTLERVPPGKDLVMVGTGTGIAPYVSMLRAHAADPPWRSFTLVHGVRLASDLGYRDELERRARGDPRFRYVPIASREAEGPGWNGRRGRVRAVLEELAPDPAASCVFLCGNPAMIQEVRDLLAPRGFTPGTFAEPGNLRFEKYW